MTNQDTPDNGAKGTGVTRELVEFARAVSYEDLPDDVRLVAKTCILDWLGVTLAGSREPLSNIVVDEITSLGGSSVSTLIGRGTKTSPLFAALANGAASHALDFDDTHLVMMGHPSVPVLPAIVSLAEERAASGKDLLASLVAGVETECRLGAALGIGHYAAGWHSTATLGTFGSAAACCHLIGLDFDSWLHAFGLAGTQAAGLKSVFGTMAKPLHAGKAAMHGMLSARLASRGFTSNTQIIETHQGFAATHAGASNSEALKQLGDRYLLLETVFKYHAACYLTHSAIESALQLRDVEKIDPEKIERVEVLVPRGHLDVCNISEPTTGLEGKFSLRATVAMALLGVDTTDMRVFTDAQMKEPTLLKVRDIVSVVPSQEVTGTQSKVVAELAGGDFLYATMDTGIPATNYELQWDRLTGKFIGLAAPVIGEERAWEVHAQVRKIEELGHVGDLLALVSPGDQR